MVAIVTRVIEAVAHRRWSAGAIALGLALLLLAGPTRAMGLVVGGVAVLLLGADWLVEGSVDLARRVGISKLLIGLTIVAFGTSAPELAVNVMAALAGNPGISFGNIIGSNIANFGLVIGSGALAAPMIVNPKIIARELPWIVFISAGVIVLAWLPATRLAGFEPPAPGFSQSDGVAMLCAFAAITIFWYVEARRHVVPPIGIDEEEVDQADETAPSRPVVVAAGLFVVGLAALLAGGKATAMGAVQLAGWLGLSDALIGLTVVAIATSLPELATVVVAARKGHADLAMGNVIGSNVFNLLLVLATTSTIRDIPVPAGSGYHDLAAMVGIAALLWLVIQMGRGRLGRGLGLMLIAANLAYLAWSVFRELRA